MHRLHRALLRALPPIAVAAALFALGRRWAALVLTSVAGLLVVLGILAPAGADRIDQAARVVADAAGRTLAAALSCIAWVLFVLPTWSAARLGGGASLRSNWLDSSSAWIELGAAVRRSPDGTVLGASRSGTADPPAPPVWRRRLLLPALATSALLALTAVQFDRTSPRRADDAPATGRRPDAPEFNAGAFDPSAHEDEPWGLRLRAEIQQLTYLPDLFTGLRLGDFEGEHVNVVDGVRATYTPDDPTVTVWCFGGSEMFGIGQRDDHTLPSVVTRLAEHDGIRVRALNFGVVGDVNWQSLERFEQELTSGRELPDLAIFYDGESDRGLASHRAGIGDVDPRSITRLPTSDDEQRQLDAKFGGVDAIPWSPEREELEIELAGTQYRRGAEIARRLGESYGVRVLHVWQPQPFAKKPHPADDELWERLDFDPATLPDTTRMYSEIRRRSGVDPVDLTTALDDVEVPVYFDSSHTNELGARVVGEALYRELLPVLRELDRNGGPEE